MPVAQYILKHRKIEAMQFQTGNEADALLFAKKYCGNVATPAIETWGDETIRLIIDNKTAKYGDYIVGDELEGVSFEKEENFKKKYEEKYVTTEIPGSTLVAISGQAQSTSYWRSWRDAPIGGKKESSVNPTPAPPEIISKTPTMFPGYFNVVVREHDGTVRTHMSMYERFVREMEYKWMEYKLSAEHYVQPSTDDEAAELGRSWQEYRSDAERFVQGYSEDETPTTGHS